MRYVRAALAAIILIVASLAGVAATSGSASALMSDCRSVLGTQSWSFGYCVYNDGWVHSIQEAAVCIWPGQPNGIRQTVRGAVVRDAHDNSTAFCPSGKVVYSMYLITT
jgi:hypothetical protein